MSDSKTYRNDATTSRRSGADEGAQPRSKADGWEAYSSWLNRAQQKSGGRHSAITRNLNSWTNYKSWADKVRGSFDKNEK
ncbi:MAG TPA: hypothetical protein VEZ88_06505 [Steroidobacteraceae bacterium]|nr:hypothetical protein [Steroidobacteraceae bacterium]